ncbi:MAG: cytochrome c3 family protein [Thermodesulfobacteriota bacterium]
MKTGLVFFTIIASILAITAVWAGNNGAENMKIFGGSRGDVPFPHHAHQARLKDCNTCHAVFPQEADGIKEMKAAGTLKPKQVMNKQCVKCHKDQKKAGNPTGPTTCSKCHVK